MAIKRCPYCKSFIEEKDKYCKNCGTQLLFPEDEFIDEQIPGEKIIEDDRERNKEDEEDLREKVQEEDDDDDEEEEDRPEEEEGEPENDDTTESLEEEKEEKDTTKLVGEDTTTRLVEEKDTTSLIEAEPGEVEKEAPPVKQELHYKTGDLDKMTRSVDDAKREIEEFLLTLKTQKGAKGDDAAEADSGEIPPPVQVMEKTIPAQSPGEDEELPPWAEKIKEAPPTDILGGGEKEKRPFQTDDFTAGIRDTVERKGWTTDSGIGIPERVTTQPALPFGEAERESEGEEEDLKKQSPETAQEEVIEEADRGGAAEEQDAYGTGALDDQEEHLQEPGGAEADISDLPPSTPLAIAFKSKALDVFIVFALWLGSIGLAARFLHTTLFRLILSSTAQVLAVFLILLACYFFLFLFFLGETLGDRFLSHKD